MRTRVLAIGFACAGALILVTAALAGNGGVAPEPSASPSGTSIRESYWFIMVFAGVVFFGVEGALIAFIVKYRRGKRPRNQDGLQIHGSTRLEILWTVVPVLILATIGTFIFVKLPSIANAPAASAADETTIRVEGRQFYWMFHYPNGAVSVGVMTAPAGQRGARGGLRPRHRRAPQLVGAAARREDRRDPRAGQRHVVQGQRGHLPRASAATCAGSSTR